MKKPIALSQKITDTAGQKIRTTHKQVNQVKAICNNLIGEFKSELDK